MGVEVDSAAPVGWDSVVAAAATEVVAVKGLGSREAEVAAMVEGMELAASDAAVAAAALAKGAEIVGTVVVVGAVLGLRAAVWEAATVFVAMVAVPLLQPLQQRLVVAADWPWARAATLRALLASLRAPMMLKRERLDPPYQHQLSTWAHPFLLGKRHCPMLDLVRAQVKAWGRHHYRPFCHCRHLSAPTPPTSGATSPQLAYAEFPVGPGSAPCFL